MTKEFAIEYIQEECEDCPEYKNGECISNSHCFEVKRMSIQAIRQMFAIDDIKAEIRHFMFEVNPSSSESDYACNYIMDLINKKIGKEGGAE